MKFPSSLPRSRVADMIDVMDARDNPKLSPVCAAAAAAGGYRAVCKLTRFSDGAEGQVFNRRDAGNNDIIQPNTGLLVSLLFTKIEVVRQFASLK